MATTNPTIGTSWGLLVTSGLEFFLSVAHDAPMSVEVAISDTEEAPAMTLRGHRLSAKALQEYNRDLIGPGYVYAISRDAPADVVLSTWS
jgi:hypothetical protein